MLKFNFIKIDYHNFNIPVFVKELKNYKEIEDEII